MSHVRSFLPGFDAGTFHIRIDSGSDKSDFDSVGLQRGGTIVPTKFADRKVDESGDRHAGLTETTDEFKLLLSM